MSGRIFLRPRHSSSPPLRHHTKMLCVVRGDTKTNYPLSVPITLVYENLHVCITKGNPRVLEIRSISSCVPFLSIPIPATPTATITIDPLNIPHIDVGLKKRQREQEELSKAPKAKKARVSVPQVKE